MGAGKFGNTISEIANDILKDRTSLKMLEAGCGSASYFDFANVAVSVGIDISQEQLNQNRFIQEKILGDIQTYPLDKEEFDIVVCWDVLEHIPRPREALLNLFNSVKKDGLLILSFPNVFSFKGLATKFTPFWFHRLLYRWSNYRSSPSRTYLWMAMLPGKVIDFAQRNGFSAIYSIVEESGTITKLFKKGNWLIDGLLYPINCIFLFLSFGKCQSLYLDNCIMVLRKRSN